MCRVSILGVVALWGDCVAFLVDKEFFYVLQFEEFWPKVS